MGFVGLGFRREARAWVYGSDLRVLRFGECGGGSFFGGTGRPVSIWQSWVPFLQGIMFLPWKDAS